MIYLLGIDGVPYDLMNDLFDKGITPNLKKISENGFFAPMKSSIPAISSTSWTTIFTGVNPGEHSIYGFTDFIPNTYTIRYPNSNAIKAPAFWQVDEKEYVVINMPMTYPAGKINGCLITGFISLDIEKSVYPKTLVEDLKDMEYKVDIDASKAHKSKNILLKELDETLDTRMKVFRKIKQMYNPEILTFIITGSDRLMHFLWDAYEDEENKFHESFMEYFRKVDAAIGQILKDIEEDDKIIILSDHGMERIKKIVNINSYFIKEKILYLEKGKEKNFKGVTERTKALALEDGRIYINSKSRFPKGWVLDENMEKIRDEISKKLMELEYEGEKVIDKIYRRDEIYNGKNISTAPDLVAIPKKGYQLRSGLKADSFEDSPLTGMHNSQAFILCNKQEKGHVVEKVDDVVGLINHWRKQKK